MPDSADSLRQGPFLVEQETFLGGVQDFLPRHKIPTNAANRLENCEVHIHGTVRRRGGLRVFNQHVTGAFAPWLLKSHIVRDKSPFLVSAYSDTATSSIVTIQDSAGAILNLTSQYQLSEETDIVQLLDRIYVCHPGQSPLYWQPGMTALDRELASPGFPGTTIPQIATAVYFQGRAWAGGDLAKPDLVYFSSGLGTDGNGESNSSPFTWDRDFQAFRMVTGRVVAIVPFRNTALIVFTDRGIESLEPNCCEILETHRLTLNLDTGCGSKHTVAHAGEEIYFMDHEGHIRSLSQTDLDENQGVTNQPTSLRIQNVIDRQNKKYLKKARATYHKGTYWIAFPIDYAPYANEMWGYSVRDQSWVGPYRFGLDVDGGTLVPMQIGGLASHRYDGDEARLYVLLMTADKTIKTYIALEPSDYTDDGTMIPVVIETASYSPGESYKKTWVHVQDELRFLHSPGDQSITVAVDVRSDEGGWVSAQSYTFTPDAGPNLPHDMPMDMTPYSRITQKLSLTSLSRAYGMQTRIRIRDNQTRWELIDHGVSGQIDNLELDR